MAGAGKASVGSSAGEPLAAAVVVVKDARPTNKKTKERKTKKKKNERRGESLFTRHPLPFFYVPACGLALFIPPLTSAFIVPNIILDDRLFHLVPCLSCFTTSSPLHTRPLCMNASAASLDLADWMLRHVPDHSMSLVQSGLTTLALFWLLYRAWLTLWKPVPELISILGVEVPDAPQVSLAGIKADAVTLHWTRPGVNKPVLKYLIQVNGVNVGESSRTETAITVTGLKASHFYNVRVIAVGSNNFQAGSKVIRLRTYGRDGRPQLTNGRVPSNLSLEEQQNSSLAESSDEAPAVRGHNASVETAPMPETPPHMAREASTQSQRRNTGGRKHSPSTAAADHALVANLLNSNHPEESMQQLAEKFETIRRETEEVVAQIARDSEEYRAQMHELNKEKEERKQQLKEKEAASLSLKNEATHTERQNRQAQNRKTQKEKTLRDKQAERQKMLEDMERWKKSVEDMKIERESWKKEIDDIQKDKAKQEEEIQGTLRKRQNSLNGLEEEIRVKGLQIKDLEEERHNLPGAREDDETRQTDAIDRQKTLEWEAKEREMSIRLNGQQNFLRELQMRLQGAQTYLQGLQTHQANTPIMHHANASGVDFDPTGQGKAKSRRTRNRKSRTNTMSSPAPGFSSVDSPFPGAFSMHTTAASPSFAPGPYFDMSNDTTGLVPISDHMRGMSAAEIRAMTAGAPLSPTAHSLLPSKIFEDDDEPPSPRAEPMGSFGQGLLATLPPAYEANQSPGSSNRSSSYISSPRTSSQNLGGINPTGRDFGMDIERRSTHSGHGEFGAIGAPSNSEQPASHKGFSSLFNFPRRNGKAIPDDGPPLGSLKLAQSQSLPRDEPSDLGNGHRRISFSTGWGIPNLLNRSSTGEATEGNGPAPARNGPRRRRGFNIFGSNEDPGSMYSERDPSSPRPVSIASSDLPRPSTDSAPFGWPAVEGALINRNSPLATNWSINAPATWSRNPSRRPSLQHHGSSSHLPTGLATEDDEFLPSDNIAGQSSPPPVGVIGTRPASSHKPVTPKLNPAAPTFAFPIFNRASKSERAKGKGKAIDTFSSPDDHFSSASAISPSDSRKSRDTPSIRTQHSIADSREGENQSLERLYSSNLSDTTTPSAASTKEPSSFQKLLRKGSSSKFSFSSIRGKKGASSERTERDGSLDGGGDDDASHTSYTSSPNIGSMGSEAGGRRSVNWGRPFSGFNKKGKDGGAGESKNGVRQSLDTESVTSEAADRDEEKSEIGL
ncbi:fibronectin type iii domain protein [Phlyctema vagabunda]|uniref:Fibronectin type iii domain protein n=1 Tax=Phlyctema vagabunda TaxID=108571 RepID=A0ABR4PQ77_9HELO